MFEGARLITGEGSAPIENSAFVIEGNRITAVGRRGEVRAPKVRPNRSHRQDRHPRPHRCAFAYRLHAQSHQRAAELHAREHPRSHAPLRLSRRRREHGLRLGFRRAALSLRDETANGRRSDRGAVPDRGPRSRAAGRDQPEQHAPFGDPDPDRRRHPPRRAGAQVARHQDAQDLGRRPRRPDPKFPPATYRRSSTKPIATTSRSWSTPPASKT